MRRVPLAPGDVVFADFGGGKGREQFGTRPAVVVGTRAHARMASELAIVVPCTSALRHWRSHVELAGAHLLSRRTFAMTEQIRTISAERIRGTAGNVDRRCLQEIADTLRTWIIQPPALRR